MARKSMKPHEIEQELEEDSSEADFSDGSDDLYAPSQLDEESEDISEFEDVSESDTGSHNEEFPLITGDDAATEPASATEPPTIAEPTIADESATATESVAAVESATEAEIPVNNINIWMDPPMNFVPRKDISQIRKCTLSPKVSRYHTESDVFLRFMPISAIKYIAQCTNQRLEIHRSSKSNRSSVKDTDYGEIMIVLGCTFIMCYNRVPAISDYWSKKKSLQNLAIKEAISRDRFQILMAKMYFAPVEQPSNAPKTYYMDDIVNCCKKTFREMRQDSPFQSIDESMTKFLGRSSMKQYMPLKPIKRGIKIWMRCDSLTGYTYDFNIYSGKETGSLHGTLGERVVNKLMETVTETDVTLCFDRFFTSVHLVNTLPYPALGTCIANRKDLPKITAKLERGEYIFKSNQHGTMAVKWQDTKEVLVLSNCHTNTVGTVKRKMKDGQKLDVPCPDIIKCYRYVMGGVDLADKMVGVYDLDRKSTKWWKKVFFRLIMTCAVNAWIVYSEIHREKKPFKDFLVDLSEQLIANGRKSAAIKRTRKDGRNSKRARLFNNIGDHLPILGTMRRRCEGCKRKGKESRTRQMCKACDLAFCKNCFTPCHS
ncbi:piggyBac transposable element-derived protein 4-like [Condylostylus longicornis]|uniref:piggyBac transposable element-derived protein 4-like n=1 Tax=Condylostylus longicornis TaxID=2530218 RepID=UPI00244DB048|nr:piggyBac transposable element-derived protein 4-like [Condylostylus longicornis]